MSAVEGACRCGRVKFRVTAPPLVTMACHCTGCQRMTASAFSLSALYPAAAFGVTQGEPVVGGLRAQPEHLFCADCMSWLFTRIPQAPWMVNVRATLLENAAGFTPFVETYTEEKLPWATTPAVRRFPRFPTDAEWGDLVGEYAAHSAAAG